MCVSIRRHLRIAADHSEEQRQGSRAQVTVRAPAAGEQSDLVSLFEIILFGVFLPAEACR